MDEFLISHVQQDEGNGVWQEEEDKEGDEEEGGVWYNWKEEEEVGHEELKAQEQLLVPQSTKDSVTEQCKVMMTF